MNAVTARLCWRLQELPFGTAQDLDVALTRLRTLLASFEESRSSLRGDMAVADFVALLVDAEPIHALRAELGAHAADLYYAENTQNPDALSVQGRIDQAGGPLTNLEAQVHWRAWRSASQCVACHATAMPYEPPAQPIRTTIHIFHQQPIKGGKS